MQALGASALVAAATGYQLIFNRGYKQAVEDCGGNLEMLKSILFDDNGQPRAEASELIRRIVEANYVTRNELESQQQSGPAQPVEPGDADNAETQTAEVPNEVLA